MAGGRRQNSRRVEMDISAAVVEWRREGERKRERARQKRRRREWQGERWAHGTWWY
jgi:hypothetical protein